MTTYVMVADKLILDLMEKNRFVYKCISLSSINNIDDCFFLSERVRQKEGNIAIFLN